MKVLGVISRIGIVILFFAILAWVSNSHAGWVPGHRLPDGRWQRGFYDPTYTTPPPEVDPRMTQPDDRRVRYRQQEVEPTDYRVDYGNGTDPRLTYRREIPDEFMHDPSLFDEFFNSRRDMLEQVDEF